MVTLKKEILQRGCFIDAEDARTELFSYINGYYNTRRRHSALEYQSPENYEPNNTKINQLVVQNCVASHMVLPNLSTKLTAIVLLVRQHEPISDIAKKLVHAFEFGLLPGNQEYVERPSFVYPYRPAHVAL